MEKQEKHKILRIYKDIDDFESLENLHKKICANCFKIINDDSNWNINQYMVYSLTFKQYFQSRNKDFELIPNFPMRLCNNCPQRLTDLYYFEKARESGQNSLVLVYDKIYRKKAENSAQVSQELRKMDENENLDIDLKFSPDRNSQGSYSPNHEFNDRIRKQLNTVIRKRSSDGSDDPNDSPHETETQKNRL